MTTSPSLGSQVIRFGPFELEARAGELRKGGIRIKLQGIYRPGCMVCRSPLWKSATEAQTPKELVLKGVHSGRSFCAPQP